MATNPIFQRSKKQRYLLLVTVLGLVVLAGVWIAFSINIGPSTETSQLPEGQQPVITQITLAALTDPSQRNQPNPSLEHKSSYRTDQLLALRIATAADISEPVQLRARLLTDAGSIVELDPPSFTVPPGTSTFCCWQVEREGTYTLQIFRPEKTITSIPLVITKGFAPPPGTGNINIF